MRNIVASMLMVAFVATSAMGGTVEFMPAEDTVGQAGGTVMMDVTVGVETLTGFDAMMLVFQADEGLMIADTGFAFDADFAAGAAFPPFVEPVPGMGLSAGAFLSNAVASDMVGTLEVVVPADMAEGDYMVYVNSDMDGLSELTLGANSEGVMGSAVVHVVPEPATIALMGLGALGLLRRRR